MYEFQEVYKPLHRIAFTQRLYLAFRRFAQFCKKKVSSRRAASSVSIWTRQVWNTATVAAPTDSSPNIRTRASRSSLARSRKTFSTCTIRSALPFFPGILFAAKLCIIWFQGQQCFWATLWIATAVVSCVSSE